MGEARAGRERRLHAAETANGDQHELCRYLRMILPQWQEVLELNSLTREQARLWSQEGEPAPQDGFRDLHEEIVKVAGSSPDPDWKNVRAAAIVVHQTLLNFAEFARHEPHGSPELADFIRARRRFQDGVLKAVRQLMDALGKVVDCSPWPYSQELKGLASRVFLPTSSTIMLASVCPGESRLGRDDQVPRAVGPSEPRTHKIVKWAETDP